MLHSLKVYQRMLSLRSVFPSVSMLSLTIVALTHDWCKMGLYEQYMKNVKDETTGVWHQEPAYKKVSHNIPLGHGTTSMFLASKFFRLTLEESLAIRWHMGEYNVADNEVNELQKANATYPMVYLIQFADRLSCVEY